MFNAIFKKFSTAVVVVACFVVVAVACFVVAVAYFVVNETNYQIIKLPNICPLEAEVSTPSNAWVSIKRHSQQQQRQQ